MNRFHCALAAVAVIGFTAIAPRAEAQVSIDIGAEPGCPYGYYDYAPYACAPYGYYGPEWFIEAPSSVLARGFTALQIFTAMWIIVSMCTAAMKARYRTVAINLSRRGVSIRLTISEEMKCGMGAAT